MISPTKQYDDRQNKDPRDLAQSGFSLYALTRLIQDCDSQPNWRSKADRCHAYYDGDQLTPEQKRLAEEEGMEPRSINLIRPVINSVLGQEAKSRTDVRMETDDDSFQDVCDALNPKLKEAERETEAHAAISNAYASGVKGGIGWVEIAKNNDPLDFPIRVEDVPRAEIWWDWVGQRGMNLLNGCRWVVRKRWVDLDVIEAAMPQHKDVLRRSVMGWGNDFTNEGDWLGEPESELFKAYAAEQSFRIGQALWSDSSRKRIKMYEVWYKVPATAVVLTLAPGKKVLYDDQDVRHVELLSRGIVQAEKTITTQIRCAVFAGPHRLSDVGTKKRSFPYKPFIAFRKDSDRSPYGLIDGMLAPADEYNDRRLRIQWMLKSKQLFIDDDAVATAFNTIEDVRRQAMKPDLMVVLDSQRRNQNALKIASDLQLQSDQVTVMQDAKQLIQDTAGRYSSQLGNAQVQSGIANSLLIEQGEQAMGEMNDNYAFFRRAVFEAIIEEVADLHVAKDFPVTIGAGKTKRVVVLNTFDPQTQRPINMVKDADLRAGVAEVPSSPAYRQQSQQAIAQIIQSLGNNPQAAAILAPAYIESSSIQNRQQIADDLRKASGLPVPGDKEAEEKAEAAQQKAMQAQDQAMQQTAEKMAAEVNAVKAKARLDEANAMRIEQQNSVAVDEAEARTANLISQVELNEARALQIAGQLRAANDPRIDDALAEAMA